MASISLPTVALIAAAGTAVSVGVSAYAAHEQGVATANADKQKARIAGEQATQNQIDMREKMLKALATQNAEAGAGGASISQANTKRQLTEAQNDLLTSQAGSSAEISLLDNAASASRTAGDLGAAASLASGAKSFAGDYANYQAVK